MYLIINAINLTTTTVRTDFMYEIKSMNLRPLRNSEGFQYHNEHIALITERDPRRLGIAAEFGAYVAAFNEFDDAFKLTQKSSFTELIKDADHERDKTRTGMYFITRGMINHHDQTISSAAVRTDILFNNTYGNVNKKSYNEQTGLIINMIQDLRGKHAADVAALGLTAWVDELERRNNVVQDLVRERAGEKTDTADLVLRDARDKTEDWYRAIVKKVNALVVVEGHENYMEYIAAHNEIIHRYTQTIKTREGRSAKKKVAEAAKKEAEAKKSETVGAGTAETVKEN